MNFIQFLAYAIVATVAFVSVHVLKQFLIHNKNEPPVIFHWLPYIGNVVSYGMDPVGFFFRCREKVTTRCVTTS